MPYDLFISYSRRDNQQGRITQLVERIKNDFAPFAKRELAPFFDQQEIHGMSDWRQRILQGLRESRLLLACLSPAYLQSEYCQWEFVEYLKYEIGHLHGFNGVAPIYFIEVPGWDGKDYETQCASWIAELRKRQHFDLRPWHEQGEAALRETAVQERMGKLNRQIVQTITRGERAEKSLGNVDAHNPHFIGRTANLRMLRENFVTPGHIGVVTAVNGVGGLGKTALAIEYAHAFADEYGGGRWQVRCAGKDDLRLALAELATPIGFEFTDDEKKNTDLQFERTRRELKKLADARAPHRCLLLLDNVDRPSLLEPAQVARLNGSDWLHVLATTRLGENEMHGAHRDRSFLAIDELPPDDALALIESYQPGGRFRSEAERDAAREIVVRLLGSFTLAVESAAVYLGQFANDVTCAAFLARLKKEGLEGLNTAANQSSEGVLHGEKRLSATLQPTLERLGAAEKLALEFAALLPPDQVPLPWLRALVAKTFPEMERDAEPGYPDPWKGVLRRILSLRLLQPTSVMDTDGQLLVTRVHRLLQLLILQSSATQMPQHQQLLLAHVQSRSDLLWETWLHHEHRWELRPLVGTGLYWIDHEIPHGACIASEAATRLKDLAYFAEAEQIMRRVLAFYEQRYGPEHITVGAQLCNLAVLLKITDRLYEAETEVQRAIRIHESNLGTHNPLITPPLTCYAHILQLTNRLPEAEMLFRRVLAINESNPDPDDSIISADLNNLGTLLREMNRMTEAEPLLRRALEMGERSFGPNHPTVAGRKINLASLLTSTNRPHEAETLMRDALAILEANYGVDHPRVATCLNNLAGSLLAMGRVLEAEPMHRRALAIDEKAFGPDHIDVARDLNGLAHVMETLKRFEPAEQMRRRALCIIETKYSCDHPIAAIGLNNLGRLLEATGRLSEAELLMQRGIKILLQFGKTTGHEHEFLRAAISNYINLLKAMSRTPLEVQSSLDALTQPYDLHITIPK